MQRLIRVSEAARILGVSEATLRRWDKAGKLLPTARLSRGERLYEAEAVERLAEERVKE
jgi:excisionase family DNA binding protein